MAEREIASGRGGVRTEEEGEEEKDVREDKQDVAKDRGRSGVARSGVVVEPIDLREQELYKTGGHQFPEQRKDAAQDGKVFARGQDGEYKEHAGHGVPKHGLGKGGRRGARHDQMNGKNRGGQAQQKLVAGGDGHRLLSRAS